MEGIRIEPSVILFVRYVQWEMGIFAQIVPVTHFLHNSLASLTSQSHHQLKQWVVNSDG